MFGQVGTAVRRASLAQDRLRQVRSQEKDTQRAERLDSHLLRRQPNVALKMLTCDGHVDDLLSQQS